MTVTFPGVKASKNKLMIAEREARKAAGAAIARAESAEQKMKDFKFALKALCDLKREKNIFGDTAKYQRKRDEAWIRAFALFPEYSQ